MFIEVTILRQVTKRRVNIYSIASYSDNEIVLGCSGQQVYQGHRLQTATYGVLNVEEEAKEIDHLIANVLWKGSINED